MSDPMQRGWFAAPTQRDTVYIVADRGELFSGYGSR